MKGRIKKQLSKVAASGILVINKEKKIFTWDIYFSLQDSQKILVTGGEMLKQVAQRG